MLYVNPLDSQMSRIQGGPENPERRHVALQELEHSFLFTLLQEMRKGMTETLAGPSSQERDLYVEMLDDGLSAEMARSGQMGLARQIEQQLAAQEPKDILQ